MRHAPSWLAASWFLLALPALVAHAGVDVEVDLNARVKVTHDPEFETQRFRFQATKGTKLNITLAGARRSTLDMAVVLDGPNGGVDLNDAKRFIDRGNRIIVRRLTVDDTGEYELSVTATGTGPFTLRLKGNPQRVWRQDVEALGAAGETNIEFAAGDGARVIFRATAPRGSAATPRFTGFLGDDLSTDGRTTTRLHSVPLPALGQGDGGDLTVGLRNDGAEAGDITVIVTTPPRRVRLEKLDFRFNRLGAASGDEAAVSATVGPGGDIVAVTDPSSGLNGAGVDVPPGALPIPTRITVTSAADVPPESEAQAGGPAVEFGPEGLEFATAATVTLPLDVTMLPVGTQPSDILVIKVSANGTRITIDPDDNDVDLIGGTVKVPTNSFSRFQANVPMGPPTINGREFWSLRFGASISEDFSEGSDSRDRGFARDVGTVSVTGGEFETSAVAIAVDALGYRFFHDDEAVGGSSSSEDPVSSSGSWNYVSGSKIEIDYGFRESPREYSVSRDGSILIHAPTENSDGRNDVALELLVQRSKNPPSLASVAGSYWVANVAFEFFDTGTSLPLGLTGARSFGSLTLTSAGKWSGTFTDRFKDFDPFNGTFDFAKAGGRAGGTFVVQTGKVPFPGALELSTRETQGPTTLLFPSKDRSMMIGLEERGTGIRVFVLVRKSSALKASGLADTYSVASVGIEDLTTYTISTSSGPVEVPDFTAFSGAGDVVIADGDIALTDFLELDITRDPLFFGGVRVGQSGPSTDPAVPLTVARSGRVRFTEDGERRLGAFTPNGMFGFFVDDPADAVDFFGLDVLVRPPEFVEPR